MSLLEAEGNVAWEMYTKIDLTNEGWTAHSCCAHTIPALYDFPTNISIVVCRSLGMHGSGAPRDKKFDFKRRKCRGAKCEFRRAILNQCKLTFAPHKLIWYFFLLGCNIPKCARFFNCDCRLNVMGWKLYLLLLAHIFEYLHCLWILRKTTSPFQGWITHVLTFLFQNDVAAIMCNYNFWQIDEPKWNTFSSTPLSYSL